MTNRFLCSGRAEPYHTVPLFKFLFVLTGAVMALCEFIGKTQFVEMYTLKHYECTVNQNVKVTLYKAAFGALNHFWFGICVVTVCWSVLNDTL